MNKRDHRAIWILVLAAVVIFMIAGSLPLMLNAQGGLSLHWSSISSGYGISSDEAFALAGTSGEIDGGASQSGDGFTMTGGFWSGVEKPPPVAPPPPPAAYRLYLPTAIGD